MLVSTVISSTDLARKTRKVVDMARRGYAVIVTVHGDEQVAVMDVVDYRLMRAVAKYRAKGSHEIGCGAPQGLSGEEVQKAVEGAGGDLQAAWDLVIGAYMNGEVSLSRAAELLKLPYFELEERLRRLGIRKPAAYESADRVKRESDLLKAA